MRLYSRGRKKIVVGVWPDAILDQPTIPTTAIAAAAVRSHVQVRGTIRSLLMQPQSGVPTLQVRIDDGTGEMNVLFLGQRRIAGIAIGRCMVVEGLVGESRGIRRMLNPVYRLQ